MGEVGGWLLGDYPAGNFLASFPWTASAAAYWQCFSGATHITGNPSLCVATVPEHPLPSLKCALFRVTQNQINSVLVLFTRAPVRCVFLVCYYAKEGISLTVSGVPHHFPCGSICDSFSGKLSHCFGNLAKDALLIVGLHHPVPLRF